MKRMEQFEKIAIIIIPLLLSFIHMSSSFIPITTRYVRRSVIQRYHPCVISSRNAVGELFQKNGRRTFGTFSTKLTDPSFVSKSTSSSLTRLSATTEEDYQSDNFTSNNEQQQQSEIASQLETSEMSNQSETAEIDKTGGISVDLPNNETTAAGSSVLAIDPTSIEIVPLDEFGSLPLNSTSSSSTSNSQISQSTFVKMFRGSANYIANHRSTCVVYHIPGKLVEWQEGFANLMDDIALSWLLGMNIVIVAGSRHQIDQRLDAADALDSIVRHNSNRVTDARTLRMVKEGAGFVRFEIERQLARSLKAAGLGSIMSDSKKKGVSATADPEDGNVISGNFFSAQPFGVIDGIDYMYTGFVRRVEVEKIKQIHKAHDIVLLTNLGVSPSGEVFNVNSESLAANTAGALSASKIIFFTTQGTALRSVETGKMIQNLRVTDARNLLDHYQVMIHPRGFASITPSHHRLSRAEIETLIKFGWSTHALEKGVKRAHILYPANGALLQELYTRDGSGTLISRDLYEGIRRADVGDVAGIYDLIDPLVKRGTLVERTKNSLERDIMSYYVYTRDNLIVATGQLKRFEGGYAEIGCLVVSKDYRSQGRGDAMLGYLERLCYQSGAAKVFVLSTQTMEWFVERGFKEVDVRQLPPSRRVSYNFMRRSKIYMKEIENSRDLDASELWWSN
mmetsp:Transcript_18169/g.26952  ORF Transcript_18169/g.26952 Transcript_18169/m.26952 type:complete len:679 (-) Transcript_18169:100-2136(-)